MVFTTCFFILYIFRQTLLNHYTCRQLQQIDCSRLETRQIRSCFFFFPLSLSLSISLSCARSLFSESALIEISLLRLLLFLKKKNEREIKKLVQQLPKHRLSITTYVYIYSSNILSILFKSLIGLNQITRKIIIKPKRKICVQKKQYCSYNRSL